MFVTPQAEMLVKTDPKERKPRPANPTYDDCWKVESFVEDFGAFIEQSCVLALSDARANVHLPGRHPTSSVEGARYWLRD
jgi:hypothetical protein